MNPSNRFLPLESDFHITVYLILSRALGQLDLVLRDTLTSLEETAHGTHNINRYRYEFE